MESVVLCNMCRSNLGGGNKNDEIPSSLENKNCSLCLGLLSDNKLYDEIVEKIMEVITSEGYDDRLFTMAMNMPISVCIREELLKHLFDADKTGAHAFASTKQLMSKYMIHKMLQKVYFHEFQKKSFI